MRQTGLTIAIIGAIQLVVSVLAFVFFSQTTPTSFATYWAASGTSVWAPQCFAGLTLLVVGGAVMALAGRHTHTPPTAPRV